MPHEATVCMKDTFFPLPCGGIGIALPANIMSCATAALKMLFSAAERAGKFRVLSAFILTKRAK